MARPPAPLSQFIVKVHSRCDLACDHCYVYESADQSWRGRPLGIPDEVISRSAERIAEHARASRLSQVQVVLHGGEPLLAGRARLGRVVTELESALQGVCALGVTIHTNGVLLDERFCEFFAEHGVKIGISIDGDRAANDRHRRYADGRSSYDKVIRAIGLLRTGRFRDLYAGLLCTIDVANDPLVVYDALLALGPPQIDFLLPHATWDTPPARRRAAGTEYADWLTAIYDRWAEDGRPVQIRTFDSILSTLRGGPSFTEALGLDPAGLVVIETDGSYEQVDSLKAAFDGAPQTGLNVFAHAVATAAQHPGILARQQGMAGLCQTCQDCPVVTSCGGGLYTHRYRTGNGFDNPSVYCPDLLKLITHISTQQPSGPVVPEAAARAHVLGSTEFRALAAGFGGADAVGQLAEAQRSLLRGLLGAVYQAAIGSHALPDPVKADLRNTWSVLTTLDRQNPEALAAVLRHPYLRVWAVRCLNQLEAAAAGIGDDDETGDGRPLAASLGHLGAAAAAAAVRAKAGAAVTVPVMDSAVHLPALGRLVLGTDEAAWPDEDEPGTATVNVISNAVIIRVGGDCWTLDPADMLAAAPCAVAGAGNTRSADWQPVRVVRVPGISVLLDDIDPYRDCHGWQVTRRLSAAEFARWQHDFEEAWQEIRCHHTGYAMALATGLTTLTPLDHAQPDRAVSAAARHAFGAIAAARPAEPGTLALLLIHEFQHVKLGAILDLYDLYDPADDRYFHAPWEDDHFFHAPWRDDKHVLESLLQGAYAHLAVTDVWRARQRTASGPAAEAAVRRFTLCRAHTRQAIEMLTTSGSLSPLGAEFVAEMSTSADR